MGVYGYHFYGPPTKYGATPLVEFDARPFQAIPIDYNEILLAWSAPTGAWDMMRLIRDPNGYTPRADMGEVLLEVAAEEAPTSIIDIASLTPGNFYYYTIWVRATGDGLWRRAADTTALTVKDWRYSGRLFELVPMIYREKDGDHETASVYGAGPLERFLQIFGFQLDHIRSEYESLKNVSNPDRVSGGLLPLMTRQYGFGFEQELGMRLARMQARNAVHIYKLKGTRLGVEAVASVLTGWAPTVSTGVNLVLDQNDASFAESVGRWALEVGNALITRIDATAAGLGQAVPIPAGASTGDIGSGLYAMRVDPQVAGDVWLSLPPTAGVPAAQFRQSWIPIPPDTTLTASIYMRSTVARNIVLYIQTVDAAGVSQSLNSDQAISTTGGWTRLDNTITTGANALFMRPLLRMIDAATGEFHYFQGFQVEVGAAPTDFQDARQTRIRFDPERINLVINPSVEVDTNGWSPIDAALTRVTGPSAVSGTYALRSTAVAGGGWTGAYSSQMPVTVGKTYTVSASLTQGTGVALMRVGLSWLDAASAPIGAGQQVVVPLTATPQRISVTGMAPPLAVSAIVSFYNIAANVTGDYFDVDAVLLEEGAAMRDYFDGQNVSGEGEYIWEGTPAYSRTLYYSRRLIKNFRMNQRIRDFLPAGSTYKLLYSAS